LGGGIVVLLLLASALWPRPTEPGPGELNAPAMADPVRSPFMPSLDGPPAGARATFALSTPAAATAPSAGESIDG
jgi:hypothetical protein